jgi:hypothetical protein
MSNSKTNDRLSVVPPADREPPKTYAVNPQSEEWLNSHANEAPDIARVKRGRQVMIGLIVAGLCVLALIALL